MHFLAVLLRKQDPSYEQSDSETSDALEEPAAEVIISGSTKRYKFTYSVLHFQCFLIVIAHV